VTGGGPALSVAQVQANLAAVRARIQAAGGDLAAVRIVGVTKAFGPPIVEVARAAGLVDLGENYAQELVAKHESVAQHQHTDLPMPVWHFLGRLQTNKVRSLAGIVGLWQSVDRPQLAREIAKRAPGAAVLVQINLSGEPQKGGCSFADAAALVADARDLGLEVRGLMGVGPDGPPEGARPGFRRLVALADELALPERSLGMSNDLDVAIEEGSTMIRIGRGVFGARPAKAGSAADDGMAAGTTTDTTSTGAP
jgi:pyridoxal phosphate enzyme (YggS family)